MNIGQLLANAARRHGERPGVVEGGQAITWREVADRVARIAAALRALGLAKGDRVLVQSRNSLRMFETKWAIFRAGLVWVPVNFRLTPGEVAYQAAQSGAAAMLLGAEFAASLLAARAASGALRFGVSMDDPIEGCWPYERLLEADPDEAEAVAADDPAWFFYTSGTTGRPKAAVLTHGQLAFVAANHLADMFPGADQTDASIHIAPLSHGAGVHALAFVARGATQVIHAGRADPETIWQTIERHRVTNFFAVPTLLMSLVDHSACGLHDHGALRFVNLGGAPIARADLVRAVARLGPVIGQHYGLGEFTAAITGLTPAEQARELAAGNGIITCGYPRTGTEVTIRGPAGEQLDAGQTGEIWVRGPACFLGYFNDPEATRAAFAGGWFHTRDLGRLDAAGRLFITGRDSDMYISGGSNVYPREIEEILLDHSRIAEAAVVGMPHRHWGEAGVAIVVPHGRSALDENEVLAWLNEKLARYKQPAAVRFWDELPKSAYGKILKKEIARRLQEEGWSFEDTV